ncbi:MAG TPA: hypothetical protein VKU62_07255 [Thermoanaerobaculia bacterium]|nr:hypothetical protein [Thermoanaerobaculia bacterium]
MIKRPRAYLPIVMSLLALSAVVAQLMLHGAARQPDENAEAHIWQLLMAAQMPVILFFAIRWLPEAPKKALGVLAIQGAAIIAAAAPVFLLRW